MTEVKFFNSNGFTLKGLLVCAEKATKETVILCHGLNCTRDSSFLPALSEFLAVERYNSLRFDFAGSGESEGEWSYSNYWGEAEDVKSACDFLEQSGLCVSAVLGHSKAATEVLMFASKYQIVKKVIYVSGRYSMGVSPSGRFSNEDLSDLELNGFFVWQGKKVTKAAWAERMEISIPNIIANFTKETSPDFLIVHCQDDSVIPVEDAFRLNADRPDIFTTPFIIKKGGHSFASSAARQQLFSAVLNFLSS